MCLIIDTLSMFVHSVNSMEDMDILSGSYNFELYTVSLWQFLSIIKCIKIVIRSFDSMRSLTV